MPTTFIILIIGATAILLIGTLIGIYLSRQQEVLTKGSLRVVVGAVVTIVWVVTIGAEILIPAYTVSVLIHGIMGAVVGYLFSDSGITFNIGGE